MTKEEYQKKMHEIDDKYNQERQRLVLAFVEENAIYKVGETIKDIQGRILTITKVHGCILYWSNPPSISYKGIELTKKLTPKKYQDGRYMAEECVEQRIILEGK